MNLIDEAVAHAGIANYIHRFYNSCCCHSAHRYSAPDDYAKKLDAAQAAPSTAALWRPP